MTRRTGTRIVNKVLPAAWWWRGPAGSSSPLATTNSRGEKWKKRMSKEEKAPASFCVQLQQWDDV
jgi:hypothetical protein